MSGSMNSREELMEFLNKAENIEDTFAVWSKAVDMGYDDMAPKILEKAQTFLPKGLGIVKQ
jgi:hypothetical protein